MMPATWFMFTAFSQPGWLWLAPLPLVLLALELGTRAPATIRISTADRLARQAGDRPSAARIVPPVLRCAGLLLLIVALAGPLNGFRARGERAGVVDIMLCVDVSSSMSEQDFYIGAQPANRLDVTKIAVANFIQNRRIVPEERFGADRLGLILYAGIAWTACPLTLDYAILEHAIERAEPASQQDRGKNGTAIGAAIGLAARRLSQSEAKSKVMVLLTDGVNNRFELDPMTAAQIAADFGIRIYTLGVGPVKDAQQMGSVTARARTRGQLVDEAALRRIASLTGGAYFRATDVGSLQQAYQEIDRLETTEVDVGSLYDYQEAHAPWIILGGLVIGASALSRRAWFEVLP